MVSKKPKQGGYILTASLSLSLSLSPCVCALWSCFRDTLNVVDELKATVSTLEGMGSVNVELMDPNVAEIYAKSPRSHVSFGVE